jgi:hypothetical protein
MAGGKGKIKNVIGKLKAKCKRMESRHNRLAIATAKLLERYKALKSSTQIIGESGEIRTATELQEAATELATRYNKDMIEWGMIHMREKRPDILEAHETELKGLKTWKEFSAKIQSLIAESRRKKVAESRAKKPAAAAPAPAAPAPAAPAPAAPSTPPAKPVVTESSSHPAVRMARRARH